MMIVRFLYMIYIILWNLKVLCFFSFVYMGISVRKVFVFVLIDTEPIHVTKRREYSKMIIRFKGRFWVGYEK